MTDNNPFPSYYEEFIHKSRYAKWIPEENRREDWNETVKRYLEFMFSHVGEKYGANEFISESWYNQLEKGIFSLEVMPSMRAMMTSGKALSRDNVAGYNCAYLPIDDVKSFDEAMYILLCGTGVGFSVERQYISKLPEIPDRLFDSDTTIVVSDSKEGWAKAYRQLLALLYSGEVPRWDTSKVRPAGARLKTFGGRASGPAPLEGLFRFTIGKFRGAVGRRLNSLECHDILCKIGEIVVVGGVRRSAMISLSNLSDDRMRRAKMGQWWETESQRALANNSISFTEKPDVGSYIEEWAAIYQSNSGERGIFNRVASQKQAAKYGRRDPNHEFGTNPCSEIILRPYQFCNLTEIVVRENDSFAALKAKVILATILGTFQSTLTHFPYLRKIWQKNTEEERLLGVSMTGIMDHRATSGQMTQDEYIDFTNGTCESLAGLLEVLRLEAVKINEKVATTLGINPSVSITCVN
jgi:ribonucleoside-triphosphate reductase (thioredoxin)